MNYTEQDAHDIVNGYLSDIRERFSKMINEEHLTEEQKDTVKQLLYFSCNHSKDDLTINDAYKKGVRI